MSSLLRSSNFLKYFSAFRKGVAMQRKMYRDPVRTCSSLNFSSFNREFSNAVAYSKPKSSSMDRQLRRLDEDVRRNGRVSLREIQDIFTEIKHSCNATSHQCLMVIRCCGNLLPEELPDAKIQLVTDIWQTLEKQGIVMDISHYNALLLVYLENEYKFSPTEFLSTLSKKGVEPNRVTFQRLIAAFCQQGNIDGATRILEFMKEKQMPISENIFNSLITGHSQANDMESAKGILSVMKQANMEPSSDTYSALLFGHAKNGDISSITEVLNLAESNQVPLNDRQLLEVAYHLAINGHAKIIDVVLARSSGQTGYNQDAKNTILRLIAKGSDEAALKVFKTMTPAILSGEQEPLPQATFILRQMVRMNRPYETIMAVCEDLRKNKVNERALHYATESCLIHGNTEMGLKLISALAQEEPVCQHYYWPAICQFGKNNDHDGVIRTLKLMSTTMNQPVPNETLREYAVEHIGADERGIMALRHAGVTVASAATAVVAYHLNNSDIAAAASIAIKYRANYDIAAVRRGIVQAYKAKADLGNLLVMVRCMVSSNNSLESSDSEESKEPENTAGQILLGIASSLRQNRSQEITRILKGYLEFGIGVSTSNAEALQDILSGEDLTDEISNLLTQLTSPQLSLVPLERTPSVKTVSFAKDEAAIMEALNCAEAKQENTDSYKFQLISLYTKQQDYDKAASLKQELRDKGVTLPADYLVQLLNVCVNNECLSEADSYYKEILATSPKPVISELTLVKLAALYLSADKFDEAIKIFETHKSETYEEKEFSYSTSCWKMLNSLAETGDSDKMDKLFNTMRTCNFIIPTNVLLGPLVKVHLIKNDLKKALDKFEECSTVYRATPWKNELACKLIQSEDAASLQRLTDLSSQVHGEVNSLYDLVLSFIECGRMRQARKILETPGLRTKHSRLSSACLRYVNDGRVTHLENLVQVTKDLPHIDRADIYYHLLGSYCNSDEVEKAVGLWTQMQEEDVQPTDRFLIRLANLLKKHGQPVPFSVPTSSTTDRLHSIEKNIEETAQMKAFRRAVYSKDIDRALQIRNSLEDNEMQSSDRSALLTLLVNYGRIGEATKLLTQWLELSLRPNIRTLNLLINTIAKTGDVETLSNIGSMIDEDLRKMTSFSNRMTHCMVEAGKSQEVLANLEKAIDSADTPEKLDHCQKTFPRGGVFSILNASPDFVPIYEKLAMKYKEKGLLEPLNILWINYFLNKEMDNADRIWPHIKNLDRLMYQPILKKARSERDVQLVEDLLARCKETNINISAVGAVHACILDILVLQERIDECSAKLDEILQTVDIQLLNYQTLRRVKIAFEKHGKLFKYTLPPRRKRPLLSSSSSDSDSDDEVRRKA